MSTLARDFGAEHSEGRGAWELEAARHWVAWQRVSEDSPAVTLADVLSGAELMADKFGVLMVRELDFACLWQVGKARRLGR